MTSRPRLRSYKALVPFCLFSLFLFALPARTQAGGHYVGPVYTYSITATDGAGNSQTLTSDDNDPDAGSGYGLNTTGGIGYDGYTGVSVQMDVTAKFTWTPDAETPDAPPPDQSYFRETGSAYAGDFFFCDSGSPEPPEAKDGLDDDPDVHTDDLSPYLFAYNYSSHGNHLKQKNGAEITFTHSLSAKLKGDYAAGSGGVFYSVASIPPPGYWALDYSEFIDALPPDSDLASTVTLNGAQLIMLVITAQAGTTPTHAVVVENGRQHFKWLGEGPTTSTFHTDYTMDVSGSVSDIPFYNPVSSSTIQYQEKLSGAAPSGDPDAIVNSYSSTYPSSGVETKTVSGSGNFTAHEDAGMAIITSITYIGPNYPDPHDVSYNPPVSAYASGFAKITFSNVRP